ncbi:dihydroorotase, partial [bacterium K02(2017)]
ASAVSGGFTRVCCMANTNPVNDNASVTDYINKRAAESGYCHVHPIGAITKGLKGEELASIAELKEAGCVAISDDGLTVQNSNLMRLALEYAKSFDLPITTHSIDKHLCQNGHMNESFFSTKLGIKGVPNAAEDVIISRDIMLAELTGAHLHVGHLSTAYGIQLVKEAKERGVKVTCEVTPHHFSLTDESICDYNTNFKMCPPLRSAKDVQAIKEALKIGGIIDAIATDHAPHGVVDKEVEFDKAAFGILGFETALPLSLNLVREGYLSLKEMIRLFTIRPSQVFNLEGGTLKVGATADITIFDPELEWTLEKDQIFSKSKNSPFINQKLKGRVVNTLVNGKIRFSKDKGLM